MGFGFLNDSSGNKSSKRLYGAILLILGIILGLSLFTYSLFSIAADHTTALDIIRMFFISGGGLLGIGVLESFKKQ